MVVQWFGVGSLVSDEVEQQPVETVLQIAPPHTRRHTLNNPRTTQDGVDLLQECAPLAATASCLRAGCQIVLASTQEALSRSLQVEVRLCETTLHFLISHLHPIS